MNKLHIHEILRNMQKNELSFSSKEEFIEHVTSNFGEDVQFFACSKEEMDATKAYDFLIRREKIIINKGKIMLSKDLSMCDEG